MSVEKHSKPSESAFKSIKSCQIWIRCYLFFYIWQTPERLVWIAPTSFTIDPLGFPFSESDLDAIQFSIFFTLFSFSVVLKSNIILGSFQTWDVFVVYLGVLVLQLASVVNDNFLGTFLSVRSVRVGSSVTLSEALVKWVRCVPMHCNVTPRGLFLSMILRAISWGIYQVEPPFLFPHLARYEWVIFKILWFLLVNPNFLTAWLSSVCILDRLLIGGEQKPIPKYQQHSQTCFFSRAVSVFFFGVFFFVIFISKSQFQNTVMSAEQATLILILVFFSRVFSLEWFLCQRSIPDFRVPHL